MTNHEAAANLARFLLEKTGTLCGKWHGTMSAADQRSLIGRFLGKGQVWIDGEAETVEHHRKVCFGGDTDCTANPKWATL